jgi:hypothetical protein
VLNWVVGPVIGSWFLEFIHASKAVLGIELIQVQDYRVRVEGWKEKSGEVL